MIFFVNFSTGVRIGNELDEVVFCSDEKILKSYLDEKYYEYMADNEYLVYEDWECDNDGEDFYDSDVYQNYIENGSVDFKELTQEEYEENYDFYDVVELD